MPTSSKPEPAKTRKLLVIDDSKDICRVVELLLRKTCDLTFAATLQDAVQAAQSTPYDAVLLDLRLHRDYSGMDVLQRLREIPHLRKTPVAAFTACAGPDERTRLLALGFDAFLEKPFRRQELLQLIDTLTNTPTQNP